MNVEPLNNAHRRDIGVALGLGAAVSYLRKRSEEFGKLPGYNTAVAIVEFLEAQHRADVAGLNIRAAAAAGVDVQTHMVMFHGRGLITAEPMDLEQLADFGPEVRP